MKKTELSNRLQTVVNMLDAQSKPASFGTLPEEVCVENTSTEEASTEEASVEDGSAGTSEYKGYCIADIGCDHGFVSIYLIQNKIASHVIAMDVNSGPLQFAKEHIKESGLESYIETRISDGFSALLKGEADAAIIAGMGGRLMVRLLTEGKEKVSSMKELILQPQSEAALLRQYLRKAGYSIVDEEMVLEDGKYYTILHVYPRAVPYEKKVPLARIILDKYGEVLIEKKHPVLAQFVSYRMERHEKILKDYPAGGDPVKREELIKIVEELKQIQDYWKGDTDEV